MAQEILYGGDFWDSARNKLNITLSDIYRDISGLGDSKEVRPQNITVADDLTLDTAYQYNLNLFVTAAKTMTLAPALSGMRVKVFAYGANVVTVTPDAADRIILNGVLLNVGQSIASDAATGEEVELVYRTQGVWYASSVTFDAV